VSFASVPLLDLSRSLEQQICDFASSEPITALFQRFGIVDDDRLSPVERMRALEAQSDQWDFRGGGERNLAAGVEFDGHTTSLVLDVVRSLGMVEASQPNRRDVDHVLILGGLVRACFSRPAAAAALLNSGLLRSSSVVALGGFRALNGDELDLAAEIGSSHLGDEFDAMEKGVRDAFDLTDAPAISDEGEDSDLIGGAWRIRVLPGGDPTLRVVAAPSSEPELRRANSADTFSWFAERELVPGSSVLLLTSAIYVPFQHCDAIRTLALPFGVQVDIVGVDTRLLAPPLGQQFATHNYLQEIRSTLRSYRMLAESLRS